MYRFVPSLLLVMFCTSVFADECPRGFDVADPLITALSVTSAVYGDFNEDGLVDVAYNYTGDRVVALNRGNAVFEPQGSVRESPLASGYGTLIAAADVNGDHHLDLIYSSDTGAILAVAFGDGHGAFSTEIESTVTPTSARWLFDVNHDGIPDFVDALDVNRFRVAFGALDGKFTEGPIIVVNSIPTSAGQIMPGDFDGDGFLDVVHVDAVSIKYAWGSADPAKFAFSAAAPGKFELSGRFGVVDLDGDGAAEIVCGHNDTLDVVRSVSRITTSSILPVPGMRTFYFLIGRDMNGDGRVDLVPGLADGTVSIALGDSKGGFAPARFASLPGARGAAVIDVYGNGSQSIAATSGKQGLRMISAVSLIAGVGAAEAVVAGDVPGGGVFEVSDVDGDGKDDLVEGDSNTRTIEVLFGDGSGHFHGGPQHHYSDPLGYTQHLIVGDFDGDGRADFAFSGNSADTLKATIEFGSDRGVFGPASLTVAVDAVLGLLHIGRGLPSGLLAVRGSDLGIVSISAGRSAQFSVIAKVTPQNGVRIADVDGDGVDEVLLFVPYTEQEISILKGPTAPWHEVAKLSQLPSSPVNVISADLNGDGLMDLLLVYDFYSEVALRRPDGTYATTTLNGWGGIAGVSVVDFDHDGIPDLLFAIYHNYDDPGYLQTLRGTGSGQFEPYATALINEPVRAPIPMDVDGDGWMDMVIDTSSGIEIVRNICVTPRLRVTAYPATVNAGQQTTLVVHPLSTDVFVGVITIREGGKVVAQSQAATFSWTPAPLAAGTHTYDIEYVDQYAGKSQTSISVVAVERRRAAHH